MPFFKLLQGATLFGPSEMGPGDVLIAGEKIAEVSPDLGPFASLPGIEVVDLKGRVLTPGFVDPHVHILGGAAVGPMVNRS